MPALLQAFLRLVALKRLGVLLFVLVATLCASSTASALEPAPTKTRVWGFDFAEHNSDVLLSAATSGKHQENRLARSEVASGSLLAAEGIEEEGATSNIPVEDPAEQQVLWRVEGQLESKLIEPLGPNYKETVEPTRKEVRSSER